MVRTDRRRDPLLLLTPVMSRIISIVELSVCKPLGVTGGIDPLFLDLGSRHVSGQPHGPNALLSGIEAPIPIQ